MKKYDVYVSGSTKVSEIHATCITKACKQFISNLDKPCKYELYNKVHATIRYYDNHSIYSNFVIMEK